MENLPGFLLKSNVVFTVLFAAYLLLREEKFLVVNRFILLAVLSTALITPLGPSLFLEGIGTDQGVMKTGVPSLPALFELHKEESSITPGWIGNGGLIAAGIALYGTVVLLLFIRFLLQIFRIVKVVKDSSKERLAGLVYCEPNEDLPPFSFFNYIVVRRDSLDPALHKDIIAHELCHCRQLHSIDVILSELGCVLFWANPLIYVYRKHVKLNLEFIADEQVLGSGTDRRAYQLNLVRIAIKETFLDLTNSFHSSKIRKRISMMNTELPHSGRRYKYSGLLPLTTMLYILINSEQPKSFTRSQIFIDATKSVVKITEGPAAVETDKFKGIYSEFKGIYIVDGRIFTDREIRDLIKRNGKLEFTFNHPPIFGIYTQNEKAAIQKWGEVAKNGAIFLEERKNNSLMKL